MAKAIFILISLAFFSLSTKIEPIIIVAFKVDYKPAIIEFVNSDSTKSFRMEARYSWKSRVPESFLRPGHYEVYVSGRGKERKLVQSFDLLPKQPLILDYTLEGECSYDLKPGETPTCPEGHTDNIVPIAYGLPGPELMKSSQAGEVYLGGCVISGCDPHHYCKAHQIEF